MDRGIWGEIRETPRSPNLNAHAERFVRTIKECCLERMILFEEGLLRKAVHEFVMHYLASVTIKGGATGSSLKMSLTPIAWERSSAASCWVEC